VRLAGLRVQCDHAINRRARIFRDLPFLPGDVEIDRAEIFSRGGLLGQIRNERGEFPTGVQSVGRLCPDSVTTSDVIAFVGKRDVGQNSGLDHLCDGEAATVANGAQRRVRIKRDRRRFIRADAAAKIDNLRWNFPAMNPRGGNAHGLGGGVGKWPLWPGAVCRSKKKEENDLNRAFR
jgi:hypothetical protein